MDDQYKKQPNPSSPILPDGTQPVELGSGKIVSWIGEGGMAVIYEIWNKELGIARAVKLLRSGTDTEALRRFRTEMSVTAQFSHPNIVQIHTVGEWHGIPYIEMERIPGESLHEVMEKRGAFPLEACTAIGTMLCKALDFMHNNTYVSEGKTYPGILHRDLKPHNIMIETSGNVKLADFGTATPTNVSLNTVDGSFIGSLLYVAPEQLFGGHGDERSDLFSIGCILYEMIVGRKVFPERKMGKLLASRGKNRYDHLGSFNMRIPKSLIKLIEKCLLKDGSKRMPSAKIVMNELEKIHKRISKHTPKEAVKKFLESENDKRSEPSKYDLSALQGFSIIAMIFIFILITGQFFLSQRQKESLIAETASEVKPESQIKPHEDNTTVNRVAIDSLQKKLLIKTMRRQYKKNKQVIRSIQPQPYQKWPVLVLGTRPPDSKRLIKSLQREHDTRDMFMILSGELHKHNYIRAWQSYSALATLQKAGRMNSFSAPKVTLSGYRRQLNNFFRNNDVAEGEFYLVKARLYYQEHDYATAYSLLSKAIALTSGFDAPPATRRTVIFYKALAAAKLYNEGKTASRKEQVTNSWEAVKTTFASVSDRRYVLAVETAMKNISEDEQK